jgi:integrase/recombinase XerD
MGSIKVILRQKKKNATDYPIVIRIIKDRKTSFIYIGEKIKLKDWDDKELRVKKSHPNSGLLNAKIQRKLTEAHNLVLKVEDSTSYTPAKTIGAKLSGKTKETFAGLGEAHLKELEKLQKFSRHVTDKARLKYINEFLSGGDVPFKAINPSLLRRFMVHLKSDREVNDRTVMNYLILMRYLFNKAISLGLIDHSSYPFGPGKIQIRFEESHKIGLNEAEVALIENKKLPPESNQWNAKNIWLASFYLAGIRVSDVLQLKWDEFVDGRLYYKMGKNKKKVSFKVPEKVNSILSLYEKSKTENIYIFPYLNETNTTTPLMLYKSVRNANHKINECMKEIAEYCKIKKNISFHISRHTFGNIAADKISPQALQKLYRHSDLKTTIGYQANFIHKDVDDALESVINFKKQKSKNKISST